MSLAVARTKIMTSLKELNMRFDQLEPHWDDGTAREFRKSHLTPLDGQSRAAIAAIENMSHVIARVRSECQ